MIAPGKAFLNKCEYSSNNSESNVVNLLSTDDDNDDNEVHSATSEDDNVMFNPALTLEHSIFGHESPEKDNTDIIIHRVLGPPCGCRRKCREKLELNHPIVIFSAFWNLPTKFLQNCYLLNCIHVEKPKGASLKREFPESRRTITAYYSVDNGRGGYVNVCKTEFMNLHGLENSYSRINSLVKMKKAGRTFPNSDGRTKREKRLNSRKAKKLAKKAQIGPD